MFVMELLSAVRDGKETVESATERLLYEMGRGGRILVVDENLRGLEQELSHLNYTTHSVDRREDDEEIKKRLRSRIFITNNGQDFADDVERYYYGLIWVQHQRDYAVMAREVEAVLMRHNFGRNLTQVVKL